MEYPGRRSYSTVSTAIRNALHSARGLMASFPSALSAYLRPVLIPLSLPVFSDELAFSDVPLSRFLLPVWVVPDRRWVGSCGSSLLTIPFRVSAMGARLCWSLLTPRGFAFLRSRWALERVPMVGARFRNMQRPSDGIVCVRSVDLLHNTLIIQILVNIADIYR